MLEFCLTGQLWPGMAVWPGMESKEYFPVALQAQAQRILKRNSWWGGAYLLFAVEQLKGWEETEGVPFYLPAQMAKCIKQLQCLEVFITSQSAAPAYSPEHHTFTPPVWEAFRVSPTKTEYYFISATSISSSRPEPFWIIPVIWNQSLCLFRIVNTSLNGVAHVPLEERSTDLVFAHQRKCSPITFLYTVRCILPVTVKSIMWPHRTVTALPVWNRTTPSNAWTSMISSACSIYSLSNVEGFWMGT